MAVARGAPTNPRALGHDEATARFLAAVESLLADRSRSFTELSVEQLASAAGTSRTMFYKHFEDKGDLLTTLAGDVVDRLFAAAGDWWALRSGTTREDLRRVLTTIVEAHVPHRFVMQAIAETAAHDARVAARLRQALQGMTDRAAEYYAEGQREGFVRPDIDATRTAGWLAWMGERGFDQLTAPADAAERALLVDALTDVLWHALYVAPD